MSDPITTVDNLEFGLPDEIIATLRQKRQSPVGGKPRPRPRQVDGLKFYQFPTGVLEDVAKAANKYGTPAPLLVLMVLYRLWFTSLHHHNPVNLTTHSLRALGVTPRQKRRALQLIEATGHITVHQEGKKNPQVTLTWLPISQSI
jgi:hypothetical protein